MARLDESGASARTVARRRFRERGYSVMELVIVAGILGVLVGVSVLTLKTAKRGHAAEQTATQVLDFLRLANQRAIADRRTVRVEIDLANRRITLTDPVTGVVRDEDFFAAPEHMQIRTPTTNVPPAMHSPYDASAVSADTQITAGSPWSVDFLSNGSAVNTTDGTPQTTVFVFWPPAGNDANATGPNNLTEIRSVSIFGPTGMVKMWRCTGETGDGPDGVPDTDDDPDEWVAR